MIFFTAGFTSIFAILIGIALWLLPTELFLSNQHTSALLLRGVLAPALAAWMTAEAINLLRPRRLFDRRLRRIAAPTIAGFIAGFIGAAIGSFALVLVDEPLHEALILVAASVVGSILVLLPMRRVRAGHCIHCGYDLRAQPGPGSPGCGICPECGARSRHAGTITNPALA